MKLSYRVFALALLVGGISACLKQTDHSRHQLPETPQPSPAKAAGVNTNQENPNQEINDRYVKRLLDEIAGRENEPAGVVFENIQNEGFKKVPAKRFLRIMNAGYSRALGVECTHCHVEEDFASDDKRPKRAAREMAVMHRTINEQLAKMEHLDLKPEERFVNCSTCHRGAINPMQ